ncbi:MAG: hypothetical protein IMY76_08140 [Chloroflexi bacterium]|nr:hypothetical protein [Chloroflexota bacterium]
MPILEISFLQSLLEIPAVSRTRRNHGLEHATLHILAEKFPQRNMAGHSDPNGFWLIGNIPTDNVTEAVHEALKRMRAGEHNLAVHPNCGTNLITAGTLAGLAGALGMWGAGPRKRDKLDRFPLVATLATLALMVAQPLGMNIQKHITTSGVPGILEVAKITPTKRGRLQAHRVLTRG